MIQLECKELNNYVENYHFYQECTRFAQEACKGDLQFNYQFNKRLTLGSMRTFVEKKINVLKFIKMLDLGLKVKTN